SAPLLAVRLHGVDVGAIEQGLAGVGVVALHALDQIVLPHHRRLGGVLLFYSLFKYLRDNVEAAPERSPGSGLVLHTLQMGGGTRHSYPAGGPAPWQAVASQGYHDVS